MNNLDIYLCLPYGSKNFVLTKPFYAYVEDKGEILSWVIPEGTPTDLASIPSVLHWWLSPTDSRIAIPALIHDSMYQRKVFSRAMADKILFQKCLSFGMAYTKASLVYLGVRLFGRRYYNKKI